MNVVRFVKKVYDAIAEYERRLDYDTTAYLLDRVNALEEDVAALRLIIGQTNATAIGQASHVDAL